MRSRTPNTVWQIAIYSVLLFNVICLLCVINLAQLFSLPVIGLAFKNIDEISLGLKSQRFGELSEAPFRPA